MLLVKVLSRLFYQFRIQWLSEHQFEAFDEVKLIVFLNHTSLYELLFLGCVPNPVLWRLSQKLVAPGADTTLSRPVVGRFYKLIAPGLVPISRKRDATWHEFMGKVKSDNIVVILPEGRMKRATGLDKDGNTMTSRGGVADILEHLNTGKILFLYSGGLHHIQSPGQRFPKLFKTISANIEIQDLSQYKELIQTKGAELDKTFKSLVIEDLDSRKHCKSPRET